MDSKKLVDNGLDTAHFAKEGRAYLPQFQEFARMSVFSGNPLTNILGILLYFGLFAYYIRHMLTLSFIGDRIAETRKKREWSQTELAAHASVSRATIEALENGRTGELGFSKISKILAALGLELSLEEAGSTRPTLDELMQENNDDQGLDRRR
ncbi:MAG TPA: helix-turn-helix transcriptional regulator [Terriglobales bacterium]|nr:helix-turn-helix transcriptional regulator [Terriglobales bacterium]